MKWQNEPAVFSTYWTQNTLKMILLNGMYIELYRTFQKDKAHNLLKLRVTLQLLILAGSRVSPLSRGASGSQKSDFNPLLLPKRHPSFGWSSFHTCPIWKERNGRGVENYCLELKIQSWLQLPGRRNAGSKSAGFQNKCFRCRARSCGRFTVLMWNPSGSSQLWDPSSLAPSAHIKLAGSFYLKKKRAISTHSASPLGVLGPGS